MKILNLSLTSLFLSLLLPLANLSAAEKEFSIQSPDETIRLDVKLTDRIYYNVKVDGKDVLWFSPLSMSTSHGEFGKNPELKKSNIRDEDETIKTVWGIRSKVKNLYQELQLDFKGDYSILFRAYDDGVAYRFRSNKGGELIVYDEEIEYRFFKDYPMVNLSLDTFHSSYEKLYTRQTIMDVTPDNLIGLPSIINKDGVFLSIMESDLFDYPGFYLSKKGTHNRPYLNGKLPPYPTKLEEGGTHMFDLMVTETADYISKTEGNRNFPWRVIAIARTDAELADTDLVYKLARPSKIKTNWIRPGKVAWDWWNAMNLTGVDFETGINNKTYEYFIDFAAKNHIEYVIMDEGWSDQFDVLLPTPQVDMERLTRYAKKKGVKLILWMIGYTIDRQYEEAFELFEKWGIAGVKVDFIDRDDQLAIEFYERIVREAAKYKLLVDYHGVSKPTGLHRTYPNLINYEGVRGNEYYKFSQVVGPPSHNVDIAFTRMMAGPLDFTPGAMRNANQGAFVTSFETPMSAGTRCHQLGMFVVYYAPLQMLCDTPTAYEQYPDILKFLSGVPTTWDETKVLSGKIGEHIVIARQKGDDWYIGGLNDWNERDIEIDLSTFAKGKYTAHILRDGINANRDATDYAYEVKKVSGKDSLKLTMKDGGGFVLHLEK